MVKVSIGQRIRGVNSRTGETGIGKVSIVRGDDSVGGNSNGLSGVMVMVVVEKSAVGVEQTPLH